MRPFMLRVLMNAAAPADAPPAGGAGTPPALTPPGTPPAAPPKQDDKPPAIETISMPKDAFEERIAKASAAAQRKLLKELGFEKSEDLQVVLKAHKDHADAQLSELDRTKKENASLKKFEEEAKEYSGIVSNMVEEQFKALPEAVQTAIDEVANGSARERLRLMKVMKAAGVGAGAPAKAPPSAPANKNPGAPPPPANDGNATKFDAWDELRKTNPVRASVFYQAHAAAIEASRPADQ